MPEGTAPYPERARYPRTFYFGPGQPGPYAGRLPARPDEEIKRDVETALFYDTWVNSYQVKVDVKDGVVTLTGTVDSAFEKRAAGDDAWDVPGVRDVRNELQVVETPIESRAAARPEQQQMGR